MLNSRPGINLLFFKYLREGAMENLEASYAPGYSEMKNKQKLKKEESKREEKTVLFITTPTCPAFLDRAVWRTRTPLFLPSIFKNLRISLPVDTPVHRRANSLPCFGGCFVSSSWHATKIF